MRPERAWVSKVAVALKAAAGARDAPAAAQALARNFREQHRIVGPLDVLSAAKLLDARVVTADLASDASLSSAEPPYLIRVKRNSPEVRKRFSIAHELGHISFYRSTNMLEAFSHRAARTEAVASAQREVEILCDSFASELLMPAAEWTSITMKFGASIQMLRRLISFYKVSGDAASRRLVEAGGWRCAVVVWETSEVAGRESVLKPLRFYRSDFLSDEKAPVSTEVRNVLPISAQGDPVCGLDRFYDGDLTFGSNTRKVFMQSGWLNPKRILATILLGEPEAKTFAAKFYSSQALRKLVLGDLILTRGGANEQYELDIKPRGPVSD